MTRQQPRLGKQSGIALIALLVLLIMAGAYAFYRSANISFGSTQQDAKLTLALARAKEALIAYAVIDDKRPGRMLCPDMIGDGVSPTLSRDDCDGWVSGGPDVYSGWLPWKTLDLVEPSDDHGTKFWYATSRFFGGDRSTPALNSDTLTSLHVDVPSGSPSNDVVAVIIATRGPLDTRNADGDEYYFSGTSKTSEDNDVIAVITRQELMAAVEKRVANEVKACLEQHVTSAENTSRTYPWPAPLSNSIFKGTAQSLFGMIPATQPGGNPDVDLKKSIDNLTAAQNTLTTAWANADFATAQQALATINEIAAYARAQIDRLFIVAEALYKSTKKEKTVAGVTTLVSIFSDLGDTPDNVAIAAERPLLATFQGALADSGIDVFLAELTDQNQVLAQKINDAVVTPSNTGFGALQTQINNIFRRKIYAYSFTPNPDISQAISAANVIAIDAVSKAAVAKNLSNYTTEPNITLANQAISRANDLINANTAIYNTILASRINVDTSEIRFLAQRLGILLAAYSAAPDANSLNTLAVALDGAIQSVNAISTGSTTVLAAKAAAVGALNATLPPNTNTVVNLTGVAITRTDYLATAIENNGDNVLLETLKIADSRLAQAISGSLDAATLKNTVDGVDYWATQTATYANDIARKARKRVNIATVSDSATSAYTRSGQLLASLDGSTGSIALLNDYIQAPGDISKATKAQAAVTATQTALSNTIGSASTLETILESGTAQAATVTRWYGDACAFLQPASGTPSWWTANNWKNTTFYQISDRVRPTIGKLKVNGTGAYPVVVISAGRALTLPPPINLQQRSIRETKHYLEGLNQDPSRELNDAKTPVFVFSNAPVSNTFNDRLAY